MKNRWKFVEKCAMIKVLIYEDGGPRMKQEKSQKLLFTLTGIVACPIIVAAVIAVIVMHLVKNGTLSVMAGTVGTIGIMVILFAVLFMGVKAFLNRFYKIMNNLGQIADGTLTIEENKLADRQDEWGDMVRSVNELVVSFAKITTSIHKAAATLKEVSGDFRTSFDDMNESMGHVSAEVGAIIDNTVSQAERTSDMEQKVNDMSKAIDVIVENVELLTNSAEKMKECNKNADSIMDELVSISQASSTAVENVRNQTDLTNQSAMQIRTVTEIIAGISSQTNLLALNASIEAARAGDAGRGFAVVASEISTMANNTQEATVRITKMIEDVSDAISNVVSVTGKMVEEITLQSTTTSETAKSFKTIEENTETIVNNSKELQNIVVHLENANHEIVDSISTISAISEEVSAHAGDTLSTTEKNIQTVQGIVTVAENLRAYTEKLNS